jgi:hypothetical protein
MAAVVVATDIMDMDKVERSISRILPVRHPRYRDNNNYVFRTNLGGEEPAFCSNLAWKASRFNSEGHEERKRIF